MNRLALLLLLCGCPLDPHLPGQSEPEGTPCEKACATLAKHECVGSKGAPGDDEVYGTEDDVSCVQVCSDYELRIGPKRAHLELVCLSVAESCEDADLCVDAAEGGP